jgi:hypothetical protein
MASYIMATEAQAKSIGGSSASVTTTLLVTKTRAENLGCTIRTCSTHTYTAA